MQTSKVELSGITREDIQAIFQDTLRNFKESKTRVIYLDASYLYNFHLDDFQHVRKFNLLGRYDIKAVLEWHRMLERWYSDQSVIIGGNKIKPLQITRSFDRVTNEGLESLALSIVSGEEENYVHRSIGKGADVVALPSDKTLGDEVDRINVNVNKEGGSLSRDGSTVYSIGNHSKGVESCDVTECGMHSTGSPSTDKMFDHSIFETPVTHVQDSDAIGSTTVVYMCAA